MNGTKTIKQALSFLFQDPDLIIFFEGNEKQYLYVLLKELTNSLKKFLLNKYSVALLGNDSSINTSLSKDESFLLIKDKLNNDIDERISNADEPTKEYFEIYNLLRRKGSRVAMLDEMSDIKKGMEVGFHPLISHFLTCYNRKKKDNKLLILDKPPKISFQNAIQGLQYSNINSLVIIALQVSNVSGVGIEHIIQQLQDVVVLHGKNINSFSELHQFFLLHLVDNKTLSYKNTVQMQEIDVYSFTINSQYGYSDSHKTAFEVISNLMQDLYVQGYISDLLMLSTMSFEKSDELIFGCPALPYFKDFWNILKVYMRL